MTPQPTELQRRLADFFPADELGTKPQTISQQTGKALVAFYLDARAVQDRLDAVVGVENWRDEYEVLPNGSVLCRLWVKVNNTEWICKCDVGSESEQPDAGDRLKAAFSDALKRAAVKWGIGRYLYSMPKTWHPYDSQKKKFATTPPVPPQFLPAADPAEVLTPAQVRDLRDLLKATAADEVAFCRYLQVPSVELLPVARLGEALAALQRKAKSQGVPLIEA